VCRPNSDEAPEGNVLYLHQRTNKTQLSQLSNVHQKFATEFMYLRHFDITNDVDESWR